MSPFFGFSVCEAVSVSPYFFLWFQCVGLCQYESFHWHQCVCVRLCQCESLLFLLVSVRVSLCQYETVPWFQCVQVFVSASPYSFVRFQYVRGYVSVTSFDFTVRETVRVSSLHTLSL